MAGKYFAPTARERSNLTRIYGSEENWNRVATRPCKQRAAKHYNEVRKAKKNGNTV
jgi:hypothetical protein